MRRKTTFGIAMLILLCCALSAQTNITGRTIDATGSPVSFTNILLLNPVDSSLIQGELSDENGYFSLNASPGTECILSSSFIGFNTNYSDVFTVSEESPMEFGDIVLSEGLELDEIQVVAKKPLYERKIDRMIVNVSNSITSSGSTALLVLEKSPGVQVNRQNNEITLMGKTGVGIMINGKVSYQPVESIVQMLSGMSSDNIEKIELITTPPAHLDAAGLGGFINIVLKKRADLGFSGNISLMGGVGEGETGSSNLSLNYRKGSWNLFGNYNYFLQAQYQEFYNYRKVINNMGTTVSDVLTERDPTQLNHDIRLGVDYEASENTTIGLLIAAYDNKWTMDAFNMASIKLNSVLADTLTMDNSERNQWKHFMTNFNIEHKFANDSKINFNIDRIFYKDENPTEYFLKYYDPAGAFINDQETRSEKITPIDITVGQFDFSDEVSSKLSYQTGLKIAISQFENDVRVEEFNGNNWESIPRFTNFSELDEKIYAAYTSVDYRLNESNTLKIGLRYEFSDSDLTTANEGTVVDREFGTLFPTIHYNKTIGDNSSLGLSLNRRITRPGFDDMAPFAIFLDPATYFFGNPGLQPAISNNVKMDYSFNSINLSLQYSIEDSTIARFQDFVDPDSNEQLFKPINLSETRILTGNISFPVYLSRHWEMQNNIILNNTVQTSYFEGDLIEINNFNYNINTTQSFILGHGFAGEINFNYNSESLWGRARLEPMYILNIGVQKKFENGSVLNFNIGDVFNSLEWRGGTDLLNQGFMTDGYFDFSNRTFSISFSTSFGNDKLKANRERTTGSEDERSRVNS